MDHVEKELIEQLKKEGIKVPAIESERIETFKRRAERDFFATISAFIDSKFFVDKNTHQRYNERATMALLTDLKRLGLNYQKITGVWAGDFEKSYLVWNTAYEWEQFQKIILKLGEYYTQWAVCIGKKDKGFDTYNIDLWETDNLENTEYKITQHWNSLSVIDAVGDYGTILTRKIRNTLGEISDNKLKRAIKLESLQTTPCLAANESLNGAYKRDILVKQLLSNNNSFLTDKKASLETINK